MNVSFLITGSLDELTTLCKFVGSLQGELKATDRQIFEIYLILEELCSNAIVHGGCRQIEVRMVKEGEKLIITLTDDGSPFDPTTALPVDACQPLGERRPGGLGIHLVRFYTSSIEYRRDNGRNVITLTISL